MTADIFIRTWKPDLCWLEYCLAFLNKNWVGPRRIVVLANKDCEEHCRQWCREAAFIFLEPWPDTHEFKTYCSLLSEGLSDADMIVNLDSDTMLLHKSTLDDLLHDGRPVIHYRPHADMGDYLGIRLYNPSLAHWFGVAPTCCFMILPPFIFWRSTIRAMRELIERRSGKSLRDALYSETPFDWRRYIEHPKRFPDWEALGYYSQLYENERYYFLDPVRDGTTERVKVYHSWTQWSPETRAELDRLLTQ